jgi:hypothetical protein
MFVGKQTQKGVSSKGYMEEKGVSHGVVYCLLGFGEPQDGPTGGFFQTACPNPTSGLTVSTAQDIQSKGTQEGRVQQKRRLQ